MMSKSSRKNLRTKSMKSSGQNAWKITSKDSNRKVHSSQDKSPSNRRVHLTPPSSASEIREALGITKSDLEIAREAIESST